MCIWQLKKKWSRVYLPILLKSVTQLHWPLSYSYRQGSRGHHGGQKTWQFQTLQFKGKSTLENIMQNIDSAERPWLSTAHNQRGSQPEAICPLLDRYKCLETFSGVTTGDRVLLASSVEGSGVQKIPYKAQDNPHKKESSGNKCQHCWGWENLAYTPSPTV